MTRTGWLDLPAAVRTAVTAETGTVTGFAPVADGLTCHTAMVLTSAAGRTFVKGVPVDRSEERAGQRMEAAVNAAVLTVGPRLLWQVTVAGWDLLGFEYVDGRHADLAAGSPDLPLVAEALQTAVGIAAPAGVPRFADRYAGHVSPEQLRLLDGDALLHTDTNPHNLLITPTRAHLIDWAMPAAGPAWVDVAFTAVRLMEADCSAGYARGWADQFPAWKGADPAAVAALVTGVCRQWEAVVGADGARPSNRRYEALLG
ncbi:phosphotransferase [Streptomyces sp. H10-C2]|uniref:phosphotransferase n=1 Tax=unclassified Streptomyces TaxID=2593676 RepID=UPI0024B9FF13|nr:MULTISPECIES: phosphotransferase [unclassified Streptomyces]MDJ0342244.1 phosphotransferase [Streptomyces sp. PH10-H1]MDJ0368758.1 phosphotransferase [Streptomyces sp. H10-C2]